MALMDMVDEFQEKNLNFDSVKYMFSCHVNSLEGAWYY